MTIPPAIRRPLARLVGFGLAAIAMTSLTACANLSTLTRAKEIDREVRRDRLQFTEEMRDAYFILGYEYYKLAEDAKAAGIPQRADEHYKRATLYTLFYRHMDRVAKDLRWAMGDNSAAARPAATTAETEPAASMPPGGADTPAPPTPPTGFQPVGRNAAGNNVGDLTKLPPLEP